MTMKTIVVSTGVLTALVHQVVAHGYVGGGSVDGVWYEGFGENPKPGNTAILVTDYNLPLYNVWDSKIACGTNPQAATAIATAHPGSTVEWKWVTHTWVDGGKTWTHMEGTERLFVGKCIGECSNTNPNDVEWAEITDVRRGYDSNSRQWAAMDLHNGANWRETLPALPNGDYLLRSELTALHYSDHQMQEQDDSVNHGWGTEFYQGCMAIRMTGSDGSWNPTTVMKFPGAYNVNEQFHYNPSFWSMDWSTFGWAATEGQYTKADGVGGGGGSNPGNNNNNGNNVNNSNNSPAPNNSNGNPPAVTNPVCNKRRRRSVEKRKHMHGHKH